jgi:transducin (beta)-like 1
VHSLQKHTEPVYSVAFSPNGRFVATGSFDRDLHVWSVDDGALVKTFHGGAGIYEVRSGCDVGACVRRVHCPTRL